MLHRTITASQYAPNVYLFTPSKDNPCLSEPSITFSAGYATTAFDKDGQTVPFLSQYGPEDFLERFVNPSLKPDNLDSAGQGLFSGTYQFKQYRFAFEKNIFHHLIFGTIFTFQDISITNVKAQFIPTSNPLTSNQILYLDKLDQQIPKTINESGLYEADFYFGYNQTLTDFNHIESFTAMLVIDISTPQSMKNDNNSIFQFPCSANIHFGYPVVGTIFTEVRDWFGVGFCGIIVPFQPVTTNISINKTSENNNLLFSQSTLAKIDQNPFFTGTIYTTLSKPSTGFTAMIAYSYSQYLSSKITPVDTIQFPITHANKSILLDGYTLGALLLELEIDCSDEQKKLAPIFSLFFSVPIAGRLYPKTYLLGGSCFFQISYNF